MNDFGGDLSKRWYIDYYLEGCRKRCWIVSKPLKTKVDRTKRELRKIKNLFVANYSYNLFDVLARMTLRPKSRQTYASDLKIFEEFFPKMKNIDPFDFKDYCVEKYHPNTVRNKIKNIKSVFQFGFDNNMLPDNPFAKLKSLPPKQDSDFHFPFTEYERGIIEPELLKNKELYLFTRFIYFTFSRIGEIQKIKVRDIDLRTRTIKFSAENVKTNKALVKPILKPLLDLILDYKILENPSSSYVFGYNLKPCFEPCQKNLPTSLFRAVLEKLKLYRKNETTIYAWKHTGNINAYLKGMDIKLIQKINGHASLETTEIYLRKLGLFLDKQAFDFEF